MGIIILILLILIYLLLIKKEHYKFLYNGGIVQNSISYVQENVVCLIGIWERLELVKINIDLLKKQTMPCKILLIVSSQKDKQFAIQNKVDWIYTDNKPLGRKWQIGLDECKKYNPNAVLINGSDDLLSTNWVKTCYHYIHNKQFDIVGKSNWYLLDLIEKKPYKLMYKNANILLGAGRMISRNILDQINWNLFPLNLNRGLDNHCNKIFNKNYAKRLVISSPKIFVISLKGKYDTLNSVQQILNANHRLQQVSLKTKEKKYLNALTYKINKKKNIYTDILSLIKVNYL
tara:strand:- start:2835 stop:3701 length:867 start_codon:yes stop_codon:yes gene_type:complete